MTTAKELGIQVDKLNRGQQGTLAATKADHALGCTSKSAVNRLAETIIPFWAAARHMPSLGSPNIVEIDQLERAQWRAIKMVRRQEHIMYEQRL